MSLTPRLSEAAVNAGCAAITALCNGGFLQVYDSSQPASADDSDGGANILARWSYTSPAYGTPVAGAATASFVNPQVDVLVSGTAAWLRAFKSDGTSVVFDGSVGDTSAYNLTFRSTTFTVGEAVAITGLQYIYQKE